MNIEKTPQSNIDSEKKHSGDKTVEVLESNIEKTIKNIDDTEGLQQPQQSEAKNSENTESEQQIKKSLDTVSDLGVVKVYDRLGKFVFSGNPDQLMIFWKNKDYGTVEDIGGISDEEGKSIFRFGPTDGHGFTDRKCIENLFQKLEGDVTNKKRIAENAQKLIELHEQLGIKQEIPVASQVEQPIETIMEQSKKTESQLENPLHRENLFDSKKAKQVVEITKDWVKYGWNFYDHLTGKDPRLEKGVDYKINLDGTPDMASYREARQKKAEAWLNNPSNKKWLEDFQKFHQEHSNNDLSFEKKIVSAKQSDGSLVDKERWTTPYLYENGWLYYETNYFDEQKGELKQPEREKNENRVYFNVDGENLMSTFSEVIDELNNSPELQKLGFQIKTADARVTGKTEVDKKKEVEAMAMNIMNQKDRIVLYLGDKGIEYALPILRKYAEKNRQKFSKEGVLLAQTLTDKNGQEIPGISITSETKGTSPDPTAFAKKYESFNDMQSKIIESCLRSLSAGLKNPKTLEAISVKYPKMKENLSKLLKSSSTKDCVETILSDPNGEEFLIKNLQVIYPQWSKAFGMEENNIAFKKKMNLEGQNFNTKTVKLEKEPLRGGFLQEQVRLPKDQWDEKFKKLIEEKIGENQNDGNEESEESTEILQELTFKRYLGGLGLDEDELKNKKVLDLGSGEGEFVKSLIEKQITQEAFGLDIDLKERTIEDKFKDNFIEGSFEEDFPIKDVDYVISLGAVSNGIWGGEELMDIPQIIEKSLSSLKEDGEIRIYPIQESAKDNPLEGIDSSRRKWTEILEKISETLEVDCEIQPRDVRVTGNDNEVILDSVLVIRKKK